jgi:hypothetical protein
MIRLRPVSIGILAVAFAFAPMTAASAHGFHHHGRGLFGGLFGLAGAVVVGAATIVTAPIAILADAASGPSNDRRGGYNRRNDGYYGYGSSPDEEGSNYYSGPRGYYGASPEYNYPPRGAYAGPPQNYGPPPDFYRGGPDNYPPSGAYNDPPQGYHSHPPAQYGPPQGYRPPSNSDRGPPDNYPPPDDGE